MEPGLPERVHVFLVDDHPLVSQGLLSMLERSGFTICGEADSIPAALEHPGLPSAHVVVFDDSLEAAAGEAWISALCRRGPRVVVFSLRDEPGWVRRVLAAGATGYVNKREAAQSLVDAIRAVAAGGIYVSPRGGGLESSASAGSG